MVDVSHFWPMVDATEEYNVITQISDPRTNQRKMARIPTGYILVTPTPQMPPGKRHQSETKQMQGVLRINLLARLEGPRTTMVSHDGRSR